MTLFKILFPGVVYDIRSEIVAQIDRNKTIEAAVVALSQRIDKYAEHFEFLEPVAAPGRIA